MANFLGLVANNGNSVKQITKHAAAARLNAPKINSRSHLLTTVLKASVSIFAAASQRLFSQLELNGWVHEPNACDDNGCAGTGSISQALVAEDGT